MIVKDHRLRAIQWMNRNMDVVALFEKFATILVERNRKFGINLLRERIRWECIYEYGDEDYKFCNDFSPYVARYLLWKHPMWKHNMRCKRTDDELAGIKYISDMDLESQADE